MKVKKSLNKQLIKLNITLGCISSSGQDVERYPSGVRLDNRNVLRALGPRTKYF